MKVFRPEETEGTTDFGGVVRPVLAAGRGGAELSCGTLTLKPGEVMKDFENHKSDEIFLIMAGEIKVEAKEGEGVFAKAGQIVYLPKGEWHLSSNPGSSETVLFWLNRD